MNELRELYQEVIVDHSKRPRNFRVPPAANRSATGDNPLCGDRIRVDVVLDEAGGAIIRDVGFQGHGCAISTAAASTMTEAIKGKPVAEARALFERYRALVTGRAEATDGDGLGKLSVFAGVREFPMRVKCATLCWHTLLAALEGRQEAVTTE